MSGSIVDTILEANALLIGQGKLETIEQYFSPDYLVHFTDGEVRGGPSVVLKVLQAIHKAFSSIHVEVEILVADQDRVAWQRTMTGVQTGAFKGFPASDREITWRDLVVSRFHEGLIEEEWVSTDLAERLLLAKKSRH
jgi:predicted ester cyclase